MIYQPIVQKKILNQREQLEFIPQEQEVIDLNPVTREAYIREHERVEKVNRPGKTLVKETQLQPIVNREKVDLRVKQGQDKEVQLDPITAPSEVYEVKKLQTIALPGKETITQPVVQEYYQQNDIHHIQKPNFDKVEIQRYYPVVQPYMQKVPVVRRIPVPVYKPADQNYTHRVQIGVPADMVSVSSEDDRKKNDRKKDDKNKDDSNSTEEILNHVDGKTMEKIAKYGGKDYSDFLPKNVGVAEWIHEGIHKQAYERGIERPEIRKGLNQLNVF